MTAVWSAGKTVMWMHDELAGKYHRHEEAIRIAWKAFDVAQRERCLMAKANGVVLKNSRDETHGDAWKFFPEWNIRDLTTGPDLLLELLYIRATYSPYDTFKAGLGCEPGDRDFIQEAIDKNGLCHEEPFADNLYILFPDDNTYGQEVKVGGVLTEELSDKLAMCKSAGVCVHANNGVFILKRQLYVLEYLTDIIDEILEEAAKSGKLKKQSSNCEEQMSYTLSKLTIQGSRTKPTLLDMVDAAQNQAKIREDGLFPSAAQPVSEVFAHAVETTFNSRPETVADEKGRKLPNSVDKYISAAIFETVQNEIRGAVIWYYIDRLLDALGKSASDKVYRVLLLQELVNVCNLEYNRSQGLAKRQVQTGTGAKWFKRIANVYDKAGNPRVTMKGKPEELTRSDPQLHYVLRLCQAETNAAKAVNWMTKLNELHRAYPMEREKVTESEAESISDLADIVLFIRDLSQAIALPPVSHKKGQLFISRLQELDAELNGIKKGVNLRSHALPIDLLWAPGIAFETLDSLDDYVADKAGMEMWYLYHDLVDDSYSDMQTQHREVKARLEVRDKTRCVPLISSPQLPDKRVEDRRQKAKTRPMHSSKYQIAPHTEKHPLEEQAPEPVPTQKFEVDSATASVFSTLFDKSQSRGSVAWTAFEGAMACLGFAVVPKFGSVYTFYPPESMGSKRSLTVHRPHQSRIEGYLVPIFARRMRRVYGRGDKTFVSTL